MPGIGPPPKPASQRARRNKDATPTTVLRFERADQPALPPAMPDGEPWPARTVEWWAQWAGDPRAEHFDRAAWESLLDTAVIHGAYWAGDLKQAAELRLRVASYGVTPADRARLRMVFAEADDADGGKGAAGPVSRERYGDLRVVASGPEASGE